MALQNMAALVAVALQVETLTLAMAVVLFMAAAAAELAVALTVVTQLVLPELVVSVNPILVVVAVLLAQRAVLLAAQGLQGVQ